MCLRGKGIPVGAKSSGRVGEAELRAPEFIFYTPSLFIGSLQKSDHSLQNKPWAPICKHTCKPMHR